MTGLIHFKYVGEFIQQCLVAIGDANFWNIGACYVVAIDAILIVVGSQPLLLDLCGKHIESYMIISQTSELFFKSSLLTLCGKPLMITLLRASSHMSQELSFHTCAAMLYSSMRGS